MKVIVCGGRDFTDHEFLFSTLNAIHGEQAITLIIHGAAPGADTLAEEWARSRGVQFKPIPANWKQHGRAAGPIRNSEMLKEQPDMVIAFPGGRGTQNMINQAKAAGVFVCEITKRSDSN